MAISMSWGKMHSPFWKIPVGLFWFFFLNTEVWKLIWIECSLELLLLSLFFLLPASWFFSIRYPEVGIKFKSSTGNNAKWAIEKPHNSCHSAHAVCWAGQALFPRHPSLSCLAASAFCRAPTSGAEVWCEPWQPVAAPRVQVSAVMLRGPGQSRSRWLWPPSAAAGTGDELPPGAGVACV